MQEMTPAPINPTLPPEEPKKINKKLLLIVGGAILFIVIIGIVAFILLAQGTNKSVTPAVVPTPTPTASQSALPAPIFKARTYTYSGNFPATPQLNNYILKSNFTTEEVASFAASLGLENTSPVDTNGLIYGSSDNANTKGLLTFDKKTGTFSYKSYGVFLPNTYNSQPPTQQATALLESLGILDPTITCNITYKSTATPNVTYVECHRMWDRLNAPLVNIGGVLNVPENVTLTSLTPGKTSANISSPNANITDVSNGGNGLARPNEFNTITVGLFSDGRVHTIDSTMRRLERSEELNPTDIITPAEALNYFRQNKSQFSLTIPAGSGTADWARIYPNNSAYTEIAAISEMTPVYIDNPLTETQAAYEPYYLIRGVARLESGYVVRFTQAIPAEKSKLAVLVAQPIAETGSLQLQTFTPFPTNSSAPQPITTSSPSNPILSTTPNNQTVPNPNDVACNVVYTGDVELKKRERASFTIQVPGYGPLTLRTAANSLGHGRTYSFVTDKVYTASPELNKVRDAFFKTVEEQYAIMSARSLMGNEPGTNRPPLNPNQRTQTSSQLILPPADHSNTSALGYPKSCDEGFNKGSATGSCYDTSRASQIRTNVTNRINQLKNNPEALDTLARSPNIFPSFTIGALDWLLIYTSTFGSSSQSLPASYIPKEGEQIECYISGNSPHIFISSDIKKIITIQIGASLTYSDPMHSNNAWSGFATNDVFTNSTGISRSSIYYEYDPTNVKFTESNQGFIVERNNATQTIQDIAKKLGLTKTEEQALTSDILNEIAKLPNSKYVKLSFINPDELNMQLPLRVSPLPSTIERIHVMVTAINSNISITPPKIKKVTRSDYSVLELGAYAKK